MPNYINTLWECAWADLSVDKPMDKNLPYFVAANLATILPT